MWRNGIRWDVELFSLFVCPPTPPPPQGKLLLVCCEPKSKGGLERPKQYQASASQHSYLLFALKISRMVFPVASPWSKSNPQSDFPRLAYEWDDGYFKNCLFQTYLLDAGVQRSTALSCSFERRVSSFAHAQKTYTGLEMTPLRNIFCWSFLTKTKQERVLPSPVYGKIWPHSTRFWLWCSHVFSLVFSTLYCGLAVAASIYGGSNNQHTHTLTT